MQNYRPSSCFTTTRATAHNFHSQHPADRPKHAGKCIFIFTNRRLCAHTRCFPFLTASESALNHHRHYLGLRIDYALYDHTGSSASRVSFASCCVSPSYLSAYWNALSIRSEHSVTFSFTETAFSCFLIPLPIFLLPFTNTYVSCRWTQKFISAAVGILLTPRSHYRTTAITH